MTLQLTKHIEPDCSTPWTQETGRERRQTKAERARTQVKRAKRTCERCCFQSDSCRKACQKIIHRNLIKVYNNLPDRITTQNINLWSILSEHKNNRDWPGAFLNVYASSGDCKCKARGGVCWFIFWPKKGQLKLSFCKHDCLPPTYRFMLWLKWHKKHKWSN